MKIIENQWKSMKINENHWKSLKIIENQWKSLKIIENHWKSLKIDENQSKSNQIESNRNKSNQIKSNRIKSNRIESNRIESNQIKSHQNQRLGAPGTRGSGHPRGGRPRSLTLLAKNFPGTRSATKFIQNMIRGIRERQTNQSAPLQKEVSTPKAKPNWGKI